MRLFWHLNYILMLNWIAWDRNFLSLKLYLCWIIWNRIVLTFKTVLVEMELFLNCELKLKGSVWNRTVLRFKLHTYAKLLWRRLCTSALSSLPSPLWPGVVVPARVLSMSQIELNSVITQNWIVWNQLFLHLTVYKQKTVHLC